MRWFQPENAAKAFGSLALPWPAGELTTIPRLPSCIKRVRIGTREGVDRGKRKRGGKRGGRALRGDEREKAVRGREISPPTVILKVGHYDLEGCWVQIFEYSSFRCRHSNPDKCAVRLYIRNSLKVFSSFLSRVVAYGLRGEGLVWLIGAVVYLSWCTAGPIIIVRYRKLHWMVA